jgi:chaperonin cofactor prefoldin
MVTATEIEAKVDAHIDVCAVRYQGLDEQIRGVNARLKRLEQTLITAAGGIILLLLGIVFKVH